LDDQGRVRSQITSVARQIQRFDLDYNIVQSSLAKIILRIPPPLRLKPLYELDVFKCSIVLYFCLIWAYKARLALYAQIKQKYQNGNIHQKLTVPTSEREGKLSNPRARAARAMLGENLRKFTETRPAAPRVRHAVISCRPDTRGAVHTYCHDVPRSTVGTRIKAVFSGTKSPPIEGRCALAHYPYTGTAHVYSHDCAGTPHRAPRSIRM
jgi:hypothetical protein